LSCCADDASGTAFAETQKSASKSWGLNMTFRTVADYLNVMYHKVVPVLEIQMLLRREIDTLYVPFFFGNFAVLDCFIYDLK
jgi:hypothetical protein